MFYVISRHKHILEIVNKDGRVEVAKLAERLEVSQVTIRKDIVHLEEKNLLKREHGAAVMVNSDDMNNRLAFNYDIKHKIAVMAAASVKNGETVMIESGSCCVLLAEELAAHKKDITIITNSAFIASYIRAYPSIKVVLLGGDFQAESQVVVGPITRKCIEDFYVDKLFIGTDGFHKGVGFTGKNLMRTETVRGMAEHASKVIVLTESKKFCQQGVVVQFKPSEISAVITDCEIPKETFEFLQENGVDVQMTTLE